MIGYEKDGNFIIKNKYSSEYICCLFSVYFLDACNLMKIIESIRNVLNRAVYVCHSYTYIDLCV